MAPPTASTTPAQTVPDDAHTVDVVAVGAGFAGLYLIYRLRQLGMSIKVFDAADDVGGTWYWNRYPGAACDIESIDYSYSFDPELQREWKWSQRYGAQPEILRYLQHVADKHQLRADIEFGARVESADWDAQAERWHVRSDRGHSVRCQYLVMASGCLSAPKQIDIDGVERFGGERYLTSRWPHEPVDFAGKRVAVVGTGSSGIQSIPQIAARAAHLTVFQRTPNFSIPARNGPHEPSKLASFEADPSAYREAARRSWIGAPNPGLEVSALSVSDQERTAHYEAMWQLGGLLGFYGAYNDLLFHPLANHSAAEFVREKIRATVTDPEVAEALCPHDHPFGTKRPCLDSGYYETYNLPHVQLVDVRRDPIVTVTETGIDTEQASFEFDMIVFATGFDAMTGAIVSVDITGTDGVTLREKWADGPKTYLGLTVAGFPNLFTVTGPGSPSVLSNMVLSIEQHVEWICSTIAHMRERSFTVIEPTQAAEDGWVQHVADVANITLYPQAASWYMGANVPGKPRVFLPYVGGVDAYRTACEEVESRGYLGFAFTGPDGRQCNDSVIRRLQPDVALLLDYIRGLGLPTYAELSVADARKMARAARAARPPGPEVGEIVDGTLPGAAGPLAYRLYRPDSPGPHPLVAYFHGGGWVLGSHDSDDPLCRDLCVRSDAIIVSVDYRHAPEARFPAAPRDGLAAVTWLSENAASLGATPGPIAVAGWSAGGNIAAVVCQMARDAGGPPIAGQLLITPVTDCDFTRPSYRDSDADYLLTLPVMRWFWDHYADPDERVHPHASPLRADNLSDLPPALVVTCEFDPLRDEGAAYAEALARAGVDAHHMPCRGHIHTSLGAVDVIISGAPVRAEIAAALRGFFAPR